MQRGFQHVPPSIELARLFAFGQRRAIPRRGEERRDTGAAGSYTLRHGPLRVQLDLDRTVEVLLFKQLVLADVAGNHLVNLTAL